MRKTMAKHQQTNGVFFYVITKLVTELAMILFKVLKIIQNNTNTDFRKNVEYSLQTEDYHIYKMNQIRIYLINLETPSFVMDKGR